MSYKPDPATYAVAAAAGFCVTEVAVDSPHFFCRAQMLGKPPIKAAAAT
jgi:hypothetical protein